MDKSVTNALWLLQRQMELESQLRTRGGNRLAAEQELFAIERRLSRYPEAVKAILATAQLLHRPLEALSEADILRSA